MEGGLNVEDLIFKKVPGNDARSFPCNWCGEVGFTYRWWVARVRFLEDAEFKIVLCSDECKDKFMESPASQAFLDDTIIEMKRIHYLKKKITPESDGRK